jgi:hypothetical protein
MTQLQHPRGVAGAALVLAFVAILMLLPHPAAAYVGPGAGLTAIGTVIAFFAAIVLAAVGFVWYPVKRLLRRQPSAAPGGTQDHRRPS